MGFKKDVKPPTHSLLMRLHQLLRHVKLVSERIIEIGMGLVLSSYLAHPYFSNALIFGLYCTHSSIGGLVLLLKCFMVFHMANCNWEAMVVNIEKLFCLLSIMGWLHIECYVLWNCQSPCPSFWVRHQDSGELITCHELVDTPNIVG